jgi:hypothetical protein
MLYSICAGQGRTYYLACASRAEADEWANAIRNNVAALPKEASKYLYLYSLSLSVACFLYWWLSNAVPRPHFVRFLCSALCRPDRRCERLRGAERHDEQRHGHEEHHGKSGNLLYSFFSSVRRCGSLVPLAQNRVPGSSCIASFSLLLCVTHVLSFTERRAGPAQVPGLVQAHAGHAAAQRPGVRRAEPVLQRPGPRGRQTRLNARLVCSVCVVGGYATESARLISGGDEIGLIYFRVVRYTLRCPHLLV